MVDFTNNECLTILRARHKFEYEYCHGMNNVCNLQSEAQCQTQSHSHYDCKADDKNNINSVKQNKNWVKSQPEAVDEAQGCNRWSMKQKKTLSQYYGSTVCSLQFTLYRRITSVRRPLQYCSCSLVQQTGTVQKHLWIDWDWSMNGWVK